MKIVFFSLIIFCSYSFAVECDLGKVHSECKPYGHHGMIIDIVSPNDELFLTSGSSYSDYFNDPNRLHQISISVDYPSGFFGDSVFDSSHTDEFYFYLVLEYAVASSNPISWYSIHHYFIPYSLIGISPGPVYPIDRIRIDPNDFEILSSNEILLSFESEAFFDYLNFAQPSRLFTCSVGLYHTPVSCDDHTEDLLIAGSLYRSQDDEMYQWLGYPCSLGTDDISFYIPIEDKPTFPNFEYTAFDVYWRRPDAIGNYYIGGIETVSGLTIPGTRFYGGYFFAVHVPGPSTIACLETFTLTESSIFRLSTDAVEYYTLLNEYYCRPVDPNIPDGKRWSGWPVCAWVNEPNSLDARDPNDINFDAIIPDFASLKPAGQTAFSIDIPISLPGHSSTTFELGLLPDMAYSFGVPLDNIRKFIRGILSLTISYWFIRHVWRRFSHV